MVSKSRLLGAVLGLVVVAMAAHYVMFGSLPLGKPQFLDNDDDLDEESFDDVTVSNSDTA